MEAQKLAEKEIVQSVEEDEDEDLGDIEQALIDQDVLEDVESSPEQAKVVEKQPLQPVSQQQANSQNQHKALQ